MSAQPPVPKARSNGSLCAWASNLHPQQLKCRLDGDFLNDSYNTAQQILFEDSTALVVEALRIIRQETALPVPDVRACGVADMNPLHLGPFILMTFIEGIYLKDVLIASGSRVLKNDIPDDTIEMIYRQRANIMFQLFKINFRPIGSIPTITTNFVKFSTIRQYFHYVLGQDWQQLENQANSVAGETNALPRYISLKVLESLIPEMIATEFDEGPFKLICDDLGLANMIGKSSEDLTTVGIVDLEWVYAGPGHKEISTLVKWSVDSGAMWLHMLLSCGFLDMGNFPYIQLQEQIGLERWSLTLEELRDTTEVKSFIERKMNDLLKYDEDLDKVEKFNAAGKMTREEFVASVRSLLRVDE
ncbi:hypothetical protein N7471_000805 [Penicillium samsonianum]|uniref:uncharacterized protein n=1 Tax=Penicillium samsonianum TaxID=1882272 RepID=UPI002549A722|nr:uncharacterized protein N7471_000805 [Penicillium samsonianum]KAJ6149606.1 hypothetical protein N7471_000805 [Penicillium samsonianum]